MSFLFLHYLYSAEYFLGLPFFNRLGDYGSVFSAIVNVINLRFRDTTDTTTHYHFTRYKTQKATVGKFHSTIAVYIRMYIYDCKPILTMYDYFYNSNYRDKCRRLSVLRNSQAKNSGIRGFRVVDTRLVS